MLPVSVHDPKFNVHDTPRVYFHGHKLQSGKRREGGGGGGGEGGGGGGGGDREMTGRV